MQLFVPSIRCIFFIVFVISTYPINLSGKVVDNSIAIIDFTMKGGAEGEDWSAGLADFSLAMLQEKGVNGFERSRLRYIFEENKLQAEGLIGQKQIVRKKLPWVRYLLNGKIEKQNYNEFGLTLLLTDMESGQERGRFDRHGKYPDDLSSVIVSLSEEVADLINSGKDEHSNFGRSDNRLGFTDSPEVAFLYYKGLDNYFNGRPGYAEYYFRRARFLDPSFYIAGQWQVRAYEHLGLDDFADLLSSQLNELVKKESNTTESINSNSKGSDRIVVSVIPPSNLQVRDVEIESILRKVIVENPDLQLFSHENIGTVAGEIDLGLSDSFDKHQLSNHEWLSTDGLFSVTTRIDSQNAKVVHIRFIDSLSGRILVEKEQVIAAEEDSIETIKELVQFIRANYITIRNRGDSVSSSLTYPLANLEKIEEGKKHLWSPSERESRGIRSFAMNSEDLHQVNQYLQVMLMHCTPQKGFDWPYIELVLKRMENLIDSNSSDAPYWYYLIQWKRIYRLWFNPWNQNKNGVITVRKDGELFEKMFGELIRNYPDSLPGLLASYAVAVDKFYSGDTKTAASIIERLGDALSVHSDLTRMKDLILTQKTGFKQHEVAAVVYFISAKIMFKSGQLEKASEFASKADRSVDKYYTSKGLPPSSTTPFFFPSLYGVQRVESAWGLFSESLPQNINVRDGFREEIAAIHSAIVPGEDKPELTVNQLRDRLNSQLPREEVVRVSSLLLNLITDELSRGQFKTSPHISQNTARRLARAVVDAERSKAQKVLNNLITAYRSHYNRMNSVCPDEVERCKMTDPVSGKKVRFPISHLSFDELMLDLYLISEQIGNLDKLATSLLATRHEGRRIEAIRSKAWLLYEDRSKKESADFLLREIERWEMIFPDSRNKNYVELLSLSAQTLIDIGEGQRALEIYRRGVEQTKHLVGADDCNDRELAGSMRFQNAVLEAEYKNRLAAVELLKEVISIGDDCDIYSLNRLTKRQKRKNARYSTMPMFAGRNGMIQMSVEFLEKLRNTEN